MLHAGCLLLQSAPTLVLALALAMALTVLGIGIGVGIGVGEDGVWLVSVSGVSASPK